MFIQEISLLEHELDHLGLLASDPRTVLEFAGEFKGSTLEHLVDQSRRLIEAQDDVKQRERSMYTEYKTAEREILREQDQGRKDIEDERWKLQADKIYVRELETNLEQMREEAETDAEREELDREKEALAEERVRMRQQEGRLAEQEAQLARDTATALARLQQQRCSQVQWNAGIKTTHVVSILK